MKYLFTLLMLACLLSPNFSKAQVKPSGPGTNLLPAPGPEPCETGDCGGGGGGGPQITGGIVFENNNQITDPTGDVLWLGYANNGYATGRSSVAGDLWFHYQNKTTTFSAFGGANTNDEVRSVVIRGAVNGVTFEFYDNSGGSKSDDWVSITFKQALPTNFSYYLSTLENSYEDAYAKVTFHYVNGLDGKVSLAKMYPIVL